MSPKKCPIAWKRNFFQGGPNWKVVAPGILVICPVDNNPNYHTKNWLFAPNIQILGSKLHIFVPSGQLEPHRQCFQHERGVSLVPWYEGTKSFNPIPKNGFLAQSWCFWQNISIFSPFDPMPDQKETMRKRCLGGSSFMWVPKLLLTPIKIRIFGPFCPMPDQKTMQTRFL